MTVRLELRIGGVDVGVEAIRRDGDGDPVVFLHGFGSAKEGYADVAFHPAFAFHPRSPAARRPAGPSPPAADRRPGWPAGRDADRPAGPGPPHPR
ncbi:hypothetical protein AB0I81_51450 [Nonomuraea sp. NPDC050404]|uniref:hypothetical protein n=1 Tax=Nonomuraea sp. NPDC050404 TaxID=3155783 RepID=UPI0033C93B3B